MDRKQLKEDLQKLPIQVICTKYGLSFKELIRISRTLYTYIDADIDENSYVNKTKNGNWTVNKYLGEGAEYFGTYRTKKEAILVRNELIDVNWDKNELDRILDELGIERVVFK